MVGTTSYASPVDVSKMETFNSTAPISLNLDIVSDSERLRRRELKPMTQGRKKVLGAFLNTKQPHSVKGRDSKILVSEEDKSRDSNSMK